MGYAFVYDIYIIQKSGLPLIAGCTGTDYCKAHMPQHEMQSGLLSAMYSFTKESFKDSNLEQILFDDIKISFYTKDDSEILMAFIHDRKFKDKLIAKQLEKAWVKFHSKYQEYFSSGIIDDSIFESFRDDLKNLKITPPSGIYNMGDLQKQKEEYSQNHPNLFSWIKNKLRITNT